MNHDGGGVECKILGYKDLNMYRVHASYDEIKNHVQWESRIEGDPRKASGKSSVRVVGGGSDGDHIKLNKGQLNALRSSYPSSPLLR